MLRGFLNDLAKLMFPRACLACKNKLEATLENNILCEQCSGKIKKNLPPFCRYCGRHLNEGGFSKNICRSCLNTRFYFDRAYSPCVYTGIVKELIHMFKYNGKDYLGPFLSGLMIDFIKEYSLPVDDIDLIVPVPLYKTKLREREFNQAQILSNHIARSFNKQAADGVLTRFRQTKTQTELDSKQRFLNVKGSFSLAQKTQVEGKKVLLIDDVLTSGATCSEASFILKEAGAKAVFALTIAN